MSVMLISADCMEPEVVLLFPALFHTSSFRSLFSLSLFRYSLLVLSIFNVDMIKLILPVLASVYVAYAQNYDAFYVTESGVCPDNAFSTFNCPPPQVCSHDGLLDKCLPPAYLID
jgi:hypothetical protein